MKLREKAIVIVSLFLVPLVSVAGSSPSYWQRFREATGDYARKAARPSSASWLKRGEMAQPGQPITDPQALAAAQEKIEQLRAEMQGKLAQLEQEKGAARMRMEEANAQAQMTGAAEARRVADQAAQEYKKAEFAVLQQKEYIALGEMGVASAQSKRTGTPEDKMAADQARKSFSEAENLTADHATQEGVQAYQATKEIGERLIQAKKDLDAAKENMRNSELGTRKYKRAADAVTRAEAKVESLGEEVLKKHHNFVAARQKADALRGDTSVTYGPAHSFSLATAIAEAEKLRLEKEEDAALLRMMDAGANAGEVGTPEAKQAADQAVLAYQKARLGTLQKEEYLASMKAGDAQGRVLQAQLDQEDTTQALKAAQQAKREYEKVKQLREGVDASVKELSAKKEAVKLPAPTSSLSQWWNRRQANKALQGTGWDTAGQTIRERQRAAEARQAAEALQRERWNPAGY